MMQKGYSEQEVPVFFIDFLKINSIAGPSKKKKEENKTLVTVCIKPLERGWKLHDINFCGTSYTTVTAGFHMSYV